MQTSPSGEGFQMLFGLLHDKMLVYVHDSNFKKSLSAQYHGPYGPDFKKILVAQYHDRTE